MEPVTPGLQADTDPAFARRAAAVGRVARLGLGVIVGNFFAGYVDGIAGEPGSDGYFTTLFGIPMWIAVASFIALMFLYPRARKA